MTLIERIEKKQKDIQKRKNLITKQEKKIESTTDEYDLRWAKDNLKTIQSKLKDLEIQLNNLFKQQEKEQKKNEVERIPAIEKFLEQWKVKVIEWYTAEYQKLLDYKAEVATKRIELDKWRIDNGFTHYGCYKEVEAKEKEMGIDYKTTGKYIKNRFHALTINLQDYPDTWNLHLEKVIESDKVAKRMILVLRVKEITGKITDASGLYIGGNGEINGIVTGENGKAKVETISAGGYNIQCWHFRVLVKEIKDV